MSESEPVSPAPDQPAQPAEPTPASPVYDPSPATTPAEQSAPVNAPPPDQAGTAPAATEPADTTAVNTSPAAPWDDETQDPVAEEQANATARAGYSAPLIGEKLPVDPDAGVIVTNADGVNHWYPDGTAGEARPMPGKPTEEQRALWAAAEAEAAGTPAPAPTTSQATTEPSSNA